MGRIWDYIKDFETVNLKSRSPKTVEAYLYDLKKFREYLKNDFETVTSDTIKEYQKYLLETGIKAKTINRKLLSIRKFIEFINIRTSNDLQIDIKLLKVHKKYVLENLLTFNEFERLVRAAKDSKRTLAIFYALYYTGVRISELLTLKIDIVDKDSVEVLGKGNKYRDIYINDKLIKYLREYIRERKHKPGSKLFINKNNDKTMSRQVVHNVIKTYAGKCKIKKSKAHAHNFRHLFAIRLLEEGVPIEQIADMLGHTDINITRIYLNRTKNELVETINRL